LEREDLGLRVAEVEELLPLFFEPAEFDCGVGRRKTAAKKPMVWSTAGSNRIIRSDKATK
jgi:hypothetical protein